MDTYAWSEQVVVSGRNVMQLGCCRIMISVLHIYCRLWLGGKDSKVMCK